MCLLSFGAAARCGVSGSLLLFIYGLVLHSQSANSLATECTECHRVIVEPNGHTSKTWRKQKTTVLFLWPYNGHRQRTTQSHSGWNIFLYTLIQRSPHYCVWYMMISDLLRLKTLSLVFASQSYSNFQKHWGHCVGRQTQWRNFLSCQISSSLLLKACGDGTLTTSDGNEIFNLQWYFFIMLPYRYVIKNICVCEVCAFFSFSSTSLLQFIQYYSAVTNQL